MHNQRLLSHPLAPEMLQVQNQRDNCTMILYEYLMMNSSSFQSRILLRHSLVSYDISMVTKEQLKSKVSLFQIFSGYNVIKKAMHRKRQYTNLSSDVLNSSSSSEFTRFIFGWQHLKKEMASNISN